TSEINDIHSGLSACGYTLPALPGPPVAAFSADNDNICLDTNNTVNFMDETVPAGSSWSWTFEGGSPATSTDQNPTVIYAADGSYDVTLEVTNAYG
ncbi:PKD domain-containing protein, partial [Algibacter sp. PT7-4]|uniref:PKD domain-containing protein n=1 Tax=Algibacter ulvanivorans TaxID=3400999 RepID=UPI003AAC97B9